MSLKEYREHIKSRSLKNDKFHTTPKNINQSAKIHQVKTIEFALAKGKSAAFLDTGLGKSFIELEFAKECFIETKKPSLILTPLAVSAQMVRESEKFNTSCDVRNIKDQSEISDGVMVTNYDRLKNFDPSSFGCVVLDESSILKSFGGMIRNKLIEYFKETPFKLAATATPSPNDHMELGNHAEFLGIMRQQEMLSKWFINDTSTASQNWRLKGHAQDDFWAWIASWARCASMPSDLGGDDTGYILPQIERKLHIVSADITKEINDGLLFRIPEMSATSFHKEKKLTLKDRCELAASLANHNEPVTVWCETNDESKMLANMIEKSVEIRGDHKTEEKERKILGFSEGDHRVIITKPKIAGFGVNWQHCSHAIFASISFSYEQHYQAVRRSHRFGQTKQVRNDVIISDTEDVIWNSINVKSKKHDEMKKRLRESMIKHQSDACVRKIYDRPIDLEFPEWIKGQ